VDRETDAENVSWQTVPHKRISDRKVVCAEYSLSSWNNETSTLSRPKVPSARHSCERHAVVGHGGVDLMGSKPNP